MKGILKRVFLLGVPVFALLAFPLLTFAHDNDSRHGRFHDRLAEGHERQHDRLDALHDRYHQDLHSRGSHRRFHRWLDRRHQRGHENRAVLHEYFHDRYGRYNDRLRDGNRYRDNWYGRREPDRRDWSNAPGYNDRHHDHSHD